MRDRFCAFYFAKRDLYENQLNTISQLTPQDGYNQAQLDAAKAVVTKNRDSAVELVTSVAVRRAVPKEGDVSSIYDETAEYASRARQPRWDWEKNEEVPASGSSISRSSAPTIYAENRLEDREKFKEEQLLEIELNRAAAEEFGLPEVTPETKPPQIEPPEIPEAIIPEEPPKEEPKPPAYKPYQPGNFETYKPGLARAAQTHGKENFYAQMGITPDEFMSTPKPAEPVLPAAAIARARRKTTKNQIWAYRSTVPGWMPSVQIPSGF